MGGAQIFFAGGELPNFYYPLWRRNKIAIFSFLWYNKGASPMFLEILDPKRRKLLPRLASKEDIAAMKIIAISDRGTKRDFIDIYFLLQEFSLEKMFEFVKKKYPNFNIYVGLRGLTCFVDAEKKQKRKLYLFHYVSWPKVKKFLIKEVKNYQEKWLK